MNSDSLKQAIARALTRDVPMFILKDKHGGFYAMDELSIACDQRGREIIGSIVDGEFVRD